MSWTVHALQDRLVLRLLTPPDIGQNITQSLVFGDRRLRHTLALVEHSLRQGMAFQTHIQLAIRISIGLDIPTHQTMRHITLFRHDPSALDRERHSTFGDIDIGGPSPFATESAPVTAEDSLLNEKLSGRIRIKCESSLWIEKN